MIKLKTLLKESQVWERKFGEPLPTLDSVMEKYQQEGGKGSGRKPEKGSAKDIEKKSMKAATDANAKMDAAEKEMERKAKEQAFKDMENESVEINEKVSDYNREYLNKRTGFDVWNDKKLPIIVKNMKLTMNDLEKTVKIKDGKSFDDVLQRISVSVNILKKYLNLR